MKRVTEPELMTEREQVEAYGNADFEEPHSNFIKLLKEYCPEITNLRSVLDLGSGAGDILLRFSKAYPLAHIDAVEGSQTMLQFAEGLLSEYSGIKMRIRFVNSMLQDFSSSTDYDLIMSNSLLHHLHNPSHFWDKIKELSQPGAHIFIMDLMRPGSLEEARELVRTYVDGEPEILRRDFYNSLLAAFTINEVREHLAEAGLGELQTEQISDRHFIAFGTCR